MTDKYNIEGKIGEGKTSNVYKITDKITGKKYAFKIIRKYPHRNVENEIAIQSKLNHPNILKIIESSEDEDHFYIILELCGKNLYEYIKEKGYIEEDEAIDIFYQIASAVKHLHDNGISHRDIKLENVVKCGALWKLIDFGFATKEKFLTEPVGTLDYLAPEIVESQKSRNFPIDVWTLGILLYDLLYQKPPFLEKTYKGTYDAIVNNEPDFSSRIISPSIEKLIKLILTKNPDNRITIDEIVNYLKLLQ